MGMDKTVIIIFIAMPKKHFIGSFIDH
jgi:hypothetical protein